MTRELIDDERASQRLDDLEDRGDAALTARIHEIEDAIAAGDGWVKRGPFDIDVDGTPMSAWLHVLEHRRERWAITWAPVDDGLVKILAVEPTASV